MNFSPTVPSPQYFDFLRRIHIEQTACSKQEDGETGKSVAGSQYCEVSRDICGEEYPTAGQGEKKRVSTATQTHKHPRCSLL